MGDTLDRQTGTNDADGAFFTDRDGIDVKSHFMLPEEPAS